MAVARNWKLGDWYVAVEYEVKDINLKLNDREKNSNFYMKLYALKLHRSSFREKLLEIPF